MGALNAEFRVAAGQLPSGICFDHDENARLQAYAGRLVVQLDQSFATFQYGDVAPTSDLGPWFNTSDNNWWVWDSTAALYVPLNPSAVMGQVPIGFIGFWAGLIASIPTYFNLLGGEWKFCNGAAISRATYSELFAIIGTQYGPGDGSTSFNIPDFRDNFLVCANQDNGGTAKTLVSDGVSLTKSRAYQDHKHRWFNIDPDENADASAGGKNKNTSGALDMSSTDENDDPIRVLPPYYSVPAAIRVL